MRKPDLYPLIDDCKVTGEQIKGLMTALNLAGGKLDDQSHASCMSLCIELEERRANQEARLFEAAHQLNIVNDAVNGGGA